MQRQLTDPAVRVSLLLIATTLTLGALKLGGDIFAPLFLAIVTGVILGPLCDLIERLGLPSRFAALTVLVFGIVLIVALAFLAEPMVWRIADTLPQIKLEMRGWISELRGLIQGLDQVNKEVEEALGGEGNGNGKEEGGAANAMPNMMNALYLAPMILGQALVFVGTLFFFLMTRKGIYAWLSTWIGTDDETETIQRRFTIVERLVSHYFITISVINAALGTTLGAALFMIGMPGAWIWGVVAFLLNYILYLGPATLIALLLVSGLVVFNGFMSLAPPAIFLSLNMIEAQFVTPTLVGRYISVNPLLIFVSLVFWLWLWGPIGGIIAIPVLVFVLVMLDIFDPEDMETPDKDASAGT